MKTMHDNYLLAGRMYVILNGEPLEDVDCFKYLWNKWQLMEDWKMDVVHRMNEGYRTWGTLKSVVSNRGLGIKTKKCLTALYGTEAWGYEKC